MKRLVLEIEVPSFNTEGMEGALADVGEPDSELFHYLQDDLMRLDVSLGVGVLEADNHWTIVGATGHVIGARLEESGE